MESCSQVRFCTLQRKNETDMNAVGTSVGGVVVPLALPPLIARFGIPTTLRIFAGAVIATLVPFLPLIRGRLPEVRNQALGPESRNRRDWYKDITFLLLLATNTLQAFGYFVPLIWLPSRS